MGMPGAGKSHWARKLGSYLGWPSLDLDGYLVEKSGRSIEEIFDRESEQGFRKRETRALISLLAEYGHSPFVLALGGGTYGQKENRLLLREFGWTIYLRTRPEVLLARLSAEGETPRPLLAGEPGLDARIRLLLRQRSADYEQADYIFEADQLSLGKFEPILNLCIGKY